MAASPALYRARSLRWRRIRLVILLAGLIAADAAAAEGERRLFAMGTELVVTVSAGTRPAPLAARERPAAGRGGARGGAARGRFRPARADRPERHPARCRADPRGGRFR